MSLTKDYKNGTKFSYAKINEIMFTVKEHIFIHLQIFERDKEDKDHNVLQSVQTFQTEIKQNCDYFSIENLNKENNNIIKACYEYIKNNVEFFKDFENS
jgi:hypothetical protein